MLSESDEAMHARLRQFSAHSLRAKKPFHGITLNRDLSYHFKPRRVTSFMTFKRSTATE